MQSSYHSCVLLDTFQDQFGDYDEEKVKQLDEQNLQLQGKLKALQETFKSNESGKMKLFLMKHYFLLQDDKTFVQRASLKLHLKWLPVAIGPLKLEVT